MHYRCGVCGTRSTSRECALHCCDDKKEPVEVAESELCPGFYIPCEGWLKDDARRAIVFGERLVRHRNTYDTSDEFAVFMAWYGFYKSQEDTAP